MHSGVGGGSRAQVILGAFVRMYAFAHRTVQHVYRLYWYILLMLFGGAMV